MGDLVLLSSYYLCIKYFDPFVNSGFVFHSLTRVACKKHPIRTRCHLPCRDMAVALGPLTFRLPFVNLKSPKLVPSLAVLFAGFDVFPEQFESR